MASHKLAACLIAVTSFVSTATFAGEPESPKTIYENAAKRQLELAWKKAEKKEGLPEYVKGLLAELSYDPSEFQGEYGNLDSTLCMSCGPVLTYTGLIEYYVSSKKTACKLLIPAPENKRRAAGPGINVPNPPTGNDRIVNCAPTR